jgi:two-component sensor histidine kinase
VHLTLVPGSISLAANRCWQVAPIVAELVDNAVRHAFYGGSGWVLVEVDVEGPTICCRVSDDGRSRSHNPSPGLGRRVVESLARTLGGEVQWRSESKGTRVVLRIPADPTTLD